MNSKHYILLISLIGSAMMVLAINSVNVGICEKSAYSCRGMFDTIEHIFYFFPLILFFSLLTYKMKESVFQAWWQFARFAIPFVFIILYIIGLGLNHHPGGWFNLDNEVDLVEYMLIYTFFVIGSVIQIFRGYRKQRKNTVSQGKG